MQETIFNKDFYPTPTDIIHQMIGGLDLKGKFVLEPSAGNGNIVDILNSIGATRVDCFEIVPDLQKIVATKGNLIGSDFLNATKEQVSHNDFIIMNPPFSKDAEHILKAWEVAPEGCHIIALCNSESINNSFSKTRRRLKLLIENNGDSECLGDAFSKADRKTVVNVSMINLFKPVVSDDFDFSGFLSEDEETDGSQVNGLMPYNEVREIVQRYIGAVKTFDEMKKMSDQMNMYIKPIGLSDGFSYNVGYNNQVTTKDAFMKSLQKESWKWIFDKVGIRKFVTSGVMKTINKFVEKQTKYPFTMKNIYSMLEVIVATRSQTMDNALIEVFDAITEHYHDNRYALEGWKTNSHYLVNKKFIIPWMTTPSWANGEISIKRNGNDDKINDLHKSLVFLTNQNRTVIGDLGDYMSANQRGDRYGRNNIPEEDIVNVEWGKWFDWGFFECRGYKKGTMHFKFKDDYVWEMFNRRVGEIKGFPLPEKI